MFKDHFSAQATNYARYRPSYPEALFVYLASLPAEHRLAWDCATGNGQAAHSLAAYFGRVVATDASAEQISHAFPHPQITYRNEPAERTTLRPTSVDLVTVATAIHWFDFDAFYAEVRRVLGPGGVLAVWSYSLLRISPEVDAVIDHYYQEVVGPHWPPERRYIDEGYRTLPFPFEEIPAPSFAMTLQWTLAEVLGYLSTWSARRQYMKEHGTDPVDEIRGALSDVWGAPEVPRSSRWQLYLRLGRPA
jgi:SAM-dependent methyltransferase